MHADKRFTVQVFFQCFHQKQRNVLSSAGKNADVVLQRFYVKNIVEKYFLIPVGAFDKKIIGGGLLNRRLTTVANQLLIFPGLAGCFEKMLKRNGF